MAKNPRTINIKHTNFPKYFTKSTVVLKVSFFLNLCEYLYAKTRARHAVLPVEFASFELVFSDLDYLLITKPITIWLPIWQRAQDENETEATRTKIHCQYSHLP